MKHEGEDHWSIDTECIHAGPQPDPAFGSVAPRASQTSTLVFANPEEGADRFAGRDLGYIYTRTGNPSVTMIEDSVSTLDLLATGIADGLMRLSVGGEDEEDLLADIKCALDPLADKHVGPEGRRLSTRAETAVASVR